MARGGGLGVALWLFYPLIHPQYLAHKINVWMHEHTSENPLEHHSSAFTYPSNQLLLRIYYVSDSKLGKAEF